MTTPDRIRLDDPNDGLQRLTATFGGHAYDRHRHETYGVGLTLWGAQSFHYRGTLRTSRAGQVMVLHPDELHDGHAGVPDGFAYRMIYLDPAVVSRALAGRPAPFVPEVVADDPDLAALLQDAFADFPRALEPLAIDVLVVRLAERLAARSDAGRSPRRQTALPHQALGRARDFLVAEAPRIVASDELEAVSGLDRFALARHFRAAFGTSPHRFQVGRRLARAQRMIVRGMPLSEAAVAAGFADQSHLTRHFSARFGLTPGRWAALTRSESGLEP